MKQINALAFEMSTEDKFALAQMQATINNLDHRAHDELKVLTLQLAEAWISQRAVSRGMVMRAAEEMAAPFLAAPRPRRRKRDRLFRLARLAWQPFHRQWA